MRTIPLSKGKAALVDDIDYERLTKYNWHFIQGKSRNTGYACRKELIDGKSTTVYMHRQVLSLPRGDKRAVDHMNLNGVDNQNANLRLCNASQNASNSLKRRTYAKRTPSSHFKGVYWSKTSNKWASYIIHNRKQIHLGLFNDEQAAALAYNRRATVLFKEFASLNPIH